jgi:HEAT repeat protein
MDTNIKRICGLLQSPDGMRRCAAAIMLTEFAPKDGAVIDALGAALKDGTQLMTRYVLEAFEAIGSSRAVPHVLPLLDSDDMEIKLRAAGILAKVGGDVVTHLGRQLGKATPQQKRVYMDILARLHTKESLQLILDSLFDPDFEVAKESCQAVRRHIGSAKPAERIAMHKQVVKFMSSPAVKRNDRTLTSCLLLIGYIGAPDARNVLLKYTSPRIQPYIRRNALIGLRGINLSGAAAVSTAKVLIKYLAENDYTNIGQTALDILEKLELPASFESQWRALLNNKHGPVRAFAARRLAGNENAASAKLMMKLLGHDDPQVSDIAAGALSRNKNATRLLLDALCRERKAEQAWRLAKILKPHNENVDKKTCKKFAAAAARDLQEGNPRYEALMYFLRNINPALADGVFHEVGLKFKKAHKWNKAVECFRNLGGTAAFDNDAKFDLAVCGVKNSAKELSHGFRTDDPSLRILQSLVTDRKFQLSNRLKKEKILAAPDLYYIGFHFSEGNGDEATFGQDLLHHIIRVWPRSREAKDARNKLKLQEQAQALRAKVAATPEA